MSSVQFILGIDWGQKKIGLAIADSQNRLAVPLRTVAKLDDVLAVIKQENIGQLVVGKPLKLSGRGDKYTAGFAGFVAALGRRSGLIIDLVDERLSTKQANKLSGSKKTKASEDAVAAMLILQSYLDKVS